jgi:hypothetical protein
VHFVGVFCHDHFSQALFSPLFHYHRLSFYGLSDAARGGTCTYSQVISSTTAGRYPNGYNYTHGGPNSYTDCYSDRVALSNAHSDYRADSYTSYACFYRYTSSNAHSDCHANSNAHPNSCTNFDSTSRGQYKYQQ